MELLGAICGLTAHRNDIILYTIKYQNNVILFAIKFASSPKLQSHKIAFSVRSFKASNFILSLFLPVNI